jgi:poly(A) polymerase
LIGRRFRLAHVYFPGGKYIEVSTFRRHSEFDSSNPETHPQADNTFGTPAEDAFRRDITINGIFYNIADFSLVDYVGGLEDLQRGSIRCIGDPEEKFVQDPVRMIRVIRHAARTGFPIEENTYRSLLSHVEKIRLCSPARVRDEFLRELREGSTQESIRLMIETGMLFALFPSFLGPLKEQRERQDFLLFAAALDSLRLSEIPVPDEFYLALFLLPLLQFFCPSAEFPRGRRGQADYLLRVRQWVVDTLGPLHFPRQTREGATQFLSAQRIFQEFLPGEKLPLRLVRKVFFQPAFHLFELGAKVRGEEPVGLSWPSEEKPFYRRGRKHRARKRKRRGAGGKPAVEGIPPGHQNP